MRASFIARSSAGTAAKSSNRFMTSIREFGMMAGMARDKIGSSLTDGLAGSLDLLRKQILTNFPNIEHGIMSVIKGVLWLSDVIGKAAYRLIEAAGNIADWWQHLDGDSKKLIETLGAVLVVWRLLNAEMWSSPVTWVLALVGALALLWEDYQTWKEGGKSLIDWAKWQPEIEEAKKAFIWLRDTLIDLKDRLGGWKNTLELIFGLMAGAKLVGMLTGIGKITAAFGLMGDAIGGAFGGLGKLAKGIADLALRNPGRPLMGSTSHPADDPVRFAPHPGMGFPASELKAVEYDEGGDSKPPLIRTTFMGMYGVDSPLPTAYLDDITQRREGHDAMQGFLDIFSHRILTQFYRIWRKYSYPATFEPGGTDSISQSLLGLVGLGIPGTAEHIATPVSRFLSLLGVLQQPGKTQEGMQALVTLLAPGTTVKVSPYCLRPVEVSQPPGFYGDADFLLDGNTPLGDEAMDASSQLLIVLSTENEQESQSWKPDGLLYQDFLVMLRVYLGWRFKAKITLTTRTRLLAAPPLGEGPFWLGMNGVLGAEGEDLPGDIPQTFTTELGYYTGLEPATPQQGNRRVTYKFN